MFSSVVWRDMAGTLDLLREPQLCSRGPGSGRRKGTYTRTWPSLITAGT